MSDGTKISFFDTETTGLRHTDKVICIGIVNAILTETQLIYVDSLELFNTVDVMISAEAERVHHISPKILLEKSKGQRPRDVAPLLIDAIGFSELIYAYNTGFDRRMIKNTYALSLESLVEEENIRDMMIDLVAVFGRRVKQQYALDMYLEREGLTEGDLSQDFRTMCSGKIEASDTAHSALYDAYCMARLYAMAYGVEWVNDAK